MTVKKKKINVRGYIIKFKLNTRADRRSVSSREHEKKKKKGKNVDTYVFFRSYKSVNWSKNLL